MNTLEKIENYILYLLILTTPLIVLPIFPNAFVTPKLTSLILFLSLLVVILIIKINISGKIKFSYSPLDLPIIILAISYLLSGIIKTPNRFEAFFYPGNATIYLSCILVYFFINQTKNKSGIFNVLAITATIVSLISILSVFGITAKMEFLPPVIKNIGFTTLNGNLPAAIYLGVIFISLIVKIIKNSNVSSKYQYFSVSIITFLGILTNIFNLLPDKSTTVVFPPYSTDWNIFTDTIKTSPLMGMGPSNYPTAFNRFRPLSYNNTNLWPTKFQNSRSQYLTMFIELGLMGIVSIIFLIYKFAKISLYSIKNRLSQTNEDNNIYLYSVWALFAVMLLFPLTLDLLLLLFTLLSLCVNTKTITLSLLPQSDNLDVGNIIKKLPSLIISIPVAAGVIYLSIFISKSARAEFLFNKTLNTLSNKPASETYGLIIKTINQNPKVDRYHATFSQMNLLLANTIIKNVENSDSKKLSDEQRNTISQLIQQAITEAKAAVTLNRQRSSNWELLALTYKSIIPFAKGADAFATQAYQQSISLDPINPNLRIGLGGIYFSNKDYERAIEQFKLAVLAKKDYANAHYNLALAYKATDDLEKANNELNLVLSLIPLDSKEYKAITIEINNLKSQKPTHEAPTVSDNLTNPTTSSTPVINPLIELEDQAKPPEVDETSTPTPVTSTIPQPIN